jgi:transcriptional regulator with XRE-family HTH domain
MGSQMLSPREDGPLKRRRTALGLSREALGGLAGGISSSTIRRIERDEVSPHPSTLAALAAALGCEADELATPPSDQRTRADRIRRKAVARLG